jgi:hypothetical protein
MKDTIDMAREARLERNGYWEFDMNRLKAFKALVRADERALAAPVQEPVAFNEELHQERERRQQLEAELMRMQGRELKLQMALNAPAAPVQEPVAWSVTWGGLHCGNFYLRKSDAIEHHKRRSLKYPDEKREVVALYTTPPAAQRQWVGLTDEEIIKATQNIAGRKNIAQAIEAKLKEKNT